MNCKIGDKGIDYCFLFNSPSKRLVLCGMQYDLLYGVS